MRRVIVIASALILSGVLLYVSFRGVSLADLQKSLRYFHLSSLAPLGVLVLVEGFCYVHRWRVLLYPMRRFTFWQAAGPMVIGLGANYVLPARSGDVLRPLILSKRYGHSPTAVITTVGVEHVTNLLIVCCLTLVGFWLVHPLPPAFATVRPFFITTVLVLVGLLLLLIFYAEGLERLGRRVLAWLPAYLEQALLPFLVNMVLGFSSMQSRWAVCQILGWGTLRWLINASIMAFLFRLAGLDISFETGLIAVGVTSAVLILPGGPAYLGPAQAGFWLVLAPFGVAKSSAIAISLAYTALYFVVSVAAGLVALGWMVSTWQSPHSPSLSHSQKDAHP